MHVALVPTIGIVDSDTDPRIVTYAIPANDESLRTVELVAGVLSVAAREGATKALAQRDAVRGHRRGQSGQRETRGDRRVGSARDEGEELERAEGDEL